MTFVEAPELLDALDSRTLSLLEWRRSQPPFRRRGWLVRRSLLAADVGGLFAAFLVAEVFYRWRVGSSEGVGDYYETIGFVVSLPAWVLTLKLYGLYDRDEERTDHSTADDFSRLTHLISLCTFLLYAAAHLTRVVDPELSKMVIFWAAAIALTTCFRAVARTFCRRSILYVQNTVIVGAGEVGQGIARRLLQHPEYGLNLVGFVDRAPRERMSGLEHLTLLGSPDDLPAMVRLLDVERVIFAFSRDSSEESLDLIRELNALDVQIDIVPRFFELLSPGVGLHTVEGVLLCGLCPTKLSRSSRFVKRSVDVVVSLFALLIAAPLLVALAAVVKLDSAGPALFRQERIGVSGTPFSILKFRTMVEDADARKLEFAHLNKHLLPGGDPRMFKIDDDPRVTRFGTVLRRWSLDELPQLWNVLRGDMSLVGPRPLIDDEARHVREWGQRRVDIKPGITGLWQVLGRDAISFEEMVKLDYLYVTTWSFGLDCALMARTVPAVVGAAVRRRQQAKQV